MSPIWKFENKNETAFIFHSLKHWVEDIWNTNQRSSTTFLHLTRMMTKTRSSNDRSNSFDSIYDDDPQCRPVLSPLKKVQKKDWIFEEKNRTFNVCSVHTSSIPKFSLSSAANDKSCSNLNCRFKRSSLARRVASNLAVVDSGTESADADGASVGATVVLFSNQISKYLDY